MLLSAIFRSIRRVLASCRPECRCSHDRAHGLPVRLVLEELESRLTPSGAVAAPGPQFQTPGVPIIFSTANAITVSDPAIGNGQDTVYVQVPGGTLTATNTGSLSAATGNGTSTLTGGIAALNNALDGLTYAPPAGFAGITPLSILLVPASGVDAGAYVHKSREKGGEANGGPWLDF